MASISTDSKKNVRILFVGSDKKRRAIRLGKVSQKTAEAVKLKVEHLHNATVTKSPLDPDTARWVAGIGDELAAKLAAVGLIPERARALSAGEFFQSWKDEKEAAGYKPTSVATWGQTVAELIDLFGTRQLSSLTHTDGEAYRAAMLARKLRHTTVHKRLAHSKAMLEDAVRLGHLTNNPFKYVRQRQGDPSERRAYVPVADIQRVIDHCPNVWWRLLVALARFGGLRIPSEPFSLTWGDVDWERERVSVPSPKTEHAGKPHRIIPLFPLLRPHLETAFHHAEEGAVYIFPEEYRRRAMGERGFNGANMRTTFGKIIRKAGVNPWPRVWHSLRASCESDLAQSFPLAVVAKWFGNTPSVALRHYVDPTDAAFTAASSWVPGGAESGAREAQKAAQAEANGIGQDRNEAAEVPEIVGESSVLSDPVSFSLTLKRKCMGIEPTGGVVHTPHRF